MRLWSDSTFDFTLELILGLCELCSSVHRNLDYHYNMNVLLHEYGLFASNFYQFAFRLLPLNYSQSQGLILDLMLASFHAKTCNNVS